MRARILSSNGFAHEGKTRFPATGSAAVPHADVHAVLPGEGLPELTARLYGVNSPENRAKLTSANANLEGNVYAPR